MRGAATRRRPKSLQGVALDALSEHASAAIPSASLDTLDVSTASDLLERIAAKAALTTPIAAQFAQSRRAATLLVGDRTIVQASSSRRAPPARHQSVKLHR